jgi:thiopurine S-methyltransferase
MQPVPELSILQGDFFDLKASDIAPIGAVYDRAALIALPPDLRARYAEHLTKLIRASADPSRFLFLQIVLERTPHDEGGPPFSIPEESLRKLYGRDFNIELLEREDAELESESGAHTDQCVYRLTLR